MELYSKTFFFQFTELWFKWVGWLVVCSALYIFSYKTEEVVAYALFFISSGLAAYSISLTAIDIAFNTIGKKQTKLTNFLVASLILINPILLVLTFSSLVEMLISKT